MADAAPGAAEGSSGGGHSGETRGGNSGETGGGGQPGERRTGRPSHPAWAHFTRGEKRNRFHHHAFCRYCAAHGAVTAPVRGVSGNMIRHLQRCAFCPAEVVAQLRLLCAQKDAASFSRKHSAEVVLHDPLAALRKRQRADADADAGDERPPPPQTTTATELQQEQAAVEELLPLQLPLLAPDVPLQAAAVAAMQPTASAPAEERPTRKPAAVSAGPAPRQSRRQDGRRRSIAAASGEQHAGPKLTGDELTRLALTTTVLSGLPWDWTCAEEAAQLFNAAGGEVHAPELSSLTLMAKDPHEMRATRLKMESIGVTLSINRWSAKFPKSTLLLFSLTNAAGETSTVDLVDLGVVYSHEVLVGNIVSCLAGLHENQTQVINIVTDSLVTHRAACAAVQESSWVDQSLPVLPCFSHVLQLLLGGVVALSEALTNTMGEVIELVQMFTNHRVLTVLRRECGDPEASLITPSSQNWYSFIDCVDSVRQYEDMVKIVAAKVLDASSSCSEVPGTEEAKYRAAKGRKDSAGNTVDELAESGLSATVIRSIQSHSFWERVVSLSELMSPIKESYKLMAARKASSTALLLSDVFYQLGRMYQQYGAIISDWDENPSAGRSVEQVRFLQRATDSIWRLYDQQLMALSYVFNYNLDDSFLDRHLSALQWLVIGKSSKDYFRRWFCAPAPGANHNRALGLGDEALAQFLEDLLAFKERKYPFDPESVCEFENPKVFYMLISDLHPMMHLFGARLCGFVTTATALGDILPGKHFLSSVPSTASAPGSLLPVLQTTLSVQNTGRANVVGFQNNPFYPSLQARPRSLVEKSGVFSSRQEEVASRWKSSLTAERVRPSTKVWTKIQWINLAKEWSQHWDQETEGGSFVLENVQASSELLKGISLSQIFKEKLPSRLPRDREDAVVDV